MKIYFFPQTAEKCSKAKFTKNPLSESRFFPCGRTDRQI